MVKLISIYIIVLITQLIAIILWGEHVWLSKFANGGVGGSPLGQVQPVLWVLLIIEVILFICLAFDYNRKTNK